MSDLTPRQREIVDYIRSELRLRGPTIRELGAQFGIRSPNGVVGHLRLLEKKGVVRRESSAGGILLVPCPLEELLDAVRDVLAVCDSSNQLEFEALKRLGKRYQEWRA